jgi:hypothetical protein
MATITARFGSGGANIVPGRSGGTPNLATVLRDVADDLSDLQVATITTANADATYGQPEADLINEIKAALNAVAGATLRTVKG